MKKGIKIIGILVGVFVAVILCTILYVWMAELPRYKTSTVALTISLDSTQIAEGERIAIMACARCHQSDDGTLSGKRLSVSGMGEMYAPNITQHNRFGIGNYSSGELDYLLRTGIKKDGKYTSPLMPQYPNMSDEDINNIIVFLKSDHRMVMPSENNVPNSQYNLMAKLLFQFVFKPLPYPSSKISIPDANNTIATGKYLATAKFGCVDCHSKSFTTLNIMEPEKSEGFFGGGNEMPDLNGYLTVSPNLTMDKETGLGNWTKEQFIKNVRLGVKPSKKGMNRSPMLPYVQMTDKEVLAIWAYLKTIPEINNKVM